MKKYTDLWIIVLFVCLSGVWNCLMAQDGSAAVPTGTLPVMHINIYDAEGDYDNTILDKDFDLKDFFSGEYWLDINGCQWMEELGAESVGSEESPLPLQIKLRGNWTRYAFSKKPFKLKLGKKKPLLGLSKSKHFALLAHADDDLGFLRNFTGFNVGHRIGINWCPSQQPVEVIFNGDYRGLYFLTETPRIEDDRIEITELADNEDTPELISGGYLVEIDNYWQHDNQIRLWEAGEALTEDYLIMVTAHMPEEYSPIQWKFIEEQMYAINRAVERNADDIWSYIDLDDMVRYYIMHEVVQNVEDFCGSTYMYRERGEGEKWHFTAPWDFGNAFLSSYNVYSFEDNEYHHVWIPTLFRNAKFQEKLKETWLWFASNCMDGLYEEIEEYTSRISQAVLADFGRWRDAELPLFSGSQPVADNREVNFIGRIVKLQLKRRMEWLKGEWGDYTTGSYAEPARDNTPAAPLPEYAKSEIRAISAGSDAGNDAARWYDIYGRQISTPTDRGIYIRVEGGSSRKVCF